MKDVAIIFSVGKNEISEKALYLLRSIKRLNENYSIYTFVVKEERELISEQIFNEIKNNSHLIFGNLPIKEYPVSSKVEALLKVEKIIDHKYLLLLDSDILFLNDFDIQNKEKYQLFLKPVHVGHCFLGSKKSLPLWKNLYNKFDLELPINLIKSTFDKKSILPYWNAGFVLANDHNFGGKWLNIIKDIYNEIPPRYQFFTDQIALAILSSKYKVKILDETYNYPLPYRLGCPSDVKILHYHEFAFLKKIKDREIIEKFKKIGIDKKTKSTDRIFALSYLISEYLYIKFVKKIIHS